MDQKPLKEKLPFNLFNTRNLQEIGVTGTKVINSARLSRRRPETYNIALTSVLRLGYLKTFLADEELCKEIIPDFEVKEDGYAHLIALNANPAIQRSGALKKLNALLSGTDLKMDEPIPPHFNSQQTEAIFDALRKMPPPGREPGK